MQATGHTFDVTHNPWKLYISDQQYGSLGHDGYHNWDILQLRYLLCVLFEYAAAIGIIDVAYIEPTGARNDLGDLWGTDVSDRLRITRPPPSSRASGFLSCPACR
jgi:hypothetical protein